jgi:hypothetical protein
MKLSLSVCSITTIGQDYLPAFSEPHSKIFKLKTNDLPFR